MESNDDPYQENDDNRHDNSNNSSSITKNPNHHPPIRMAWTQESIDSILTIILIFQRYIGSSKEVPIILIEQLKEYILLPTLQNLQFDSSFHLLKCTTTVRNRNGSTAMSADNSHQSIQIYDFSVSSSSTANNDPNEDTTPPTTTTTSSDDNDDNNNNNNQTNQEEDLLTIKYVRKFDHDTHILNVKTGKVQHYKQNYMSLSSSSNYNSHNQQSDFTNQLPEDHVSSEHPTGTNLLLNYWIAPQKWLQCPGRSVIIRPHDLQTMQIRTSTSNTTTTFTNDNDTTTAGGIPIIRTNTIPYNTSNPSTVSNQKEIALCNSSIQALQEGYTLLLIIGNLICVPLPSIPCQRTLGSNRCLPFVGMMWKEGQPQQQQPPPSPQTAASSSSSTFLVGQKKKKKINSHPKRADDLRFIIAERAHRLYGFNGCRIDTPTTTHPRSNNYIECTRFLDNQMYIWDIHHDVFKYVPGTWS